MEKLAPTHDWWDHIYDCAKERGEAMGFEIHDINFTGFWSQGDGACWVGRVDILKWLELNKPEDVNAHIVTALIEDGWIERYVSISARDNHYSHSNTMSIAGIDSHEAYNDEVLEKPSFFQGASVMQMYDALYEGYFADLKQEILDSAKHYADDIYYQLRDAYEHLSSEEVIAELCDANEYLFMEDGELI